jgi:hypothetical protein
VGHVPKAKALLRELVVWLESHGHPFQFSTSVTLNVAQDAELLALFRAARFKYFLVGIETPDPAALRTAQKPQNLGFSIPEAVDRIYRRAGATVHSGFLLGLDDEAADIGDRIIQCIDATSIPWVMAGVVYPLPGRSSLAASTPRAALPCGPGLRRTSPSGIRSPLESSSGRDGHRRRCWTICCGSFGTPSIPRATSRAVQRP